MGQPGFFDADKRLAALSKKGDPLEAIAALVPWESFRALARGAGENLGEQDAFASIVLSFPGEPHAEWTRHWEGEKQEQAEVECRTMSPISIIFRRFDRLNLPRVDVVDDEKLEKIEEHTKATGERDHQGERTQLLRGRDFNCADFSDYADLRRVDLTDASLRGARLRLSKLQGASLDNAQLQGASLEGVQLQGASLDNAQLQGASLEGVQLQGASLDYAQLQGASLFVAQLQGAYLDYAQLQGASLEGVQLQGASLNWAKLQGAYLDYAQLQGASLVNAQLQGASLNVAQLQGASLDRAALRETALSRAAVWRARNANCGDAHVQDSKYDAIIHFDLSEPDKSVHATPEATAEFIDDAVIGISDPKRKQAAIDRLRAGLVVDPAKDDTAKIENDWRACEDSSGKVPQAIFDKKHAAFLRDLVCDATESRAAIAKGVIRNWIYKGGIRNWIYDDEDRRDFSAQLARGLLGEDEKACAATKDLDEADKKRLRRRAR